MESLLSPNMKIDCAIVSSNNNKLYLDFWPYVSKIWKVKFDIEPILLYVGDDEPDISREYGRVIRVRPSTKYPEYIQSLFVRYWYATTLGDKVGIISDIDMFPISTYYFKDRIKDVEDGKYVHLNPCIGTYGLIPSCYHVARGDTFKSVFCLQDGFEESLAALEKNNRLAGQEYWFADEIFATKKIAEHNKQDAFVLMARANGQNGHRIDRSKWKYSESMLSQGYYWDAHMIRPVDKYKLEIEKLMGLIIGEE